MALTSHLCQVSATRSSTRAASSPDGGSCSRVKGNAVKVLRSRIPPSRQQLAEVEDRRRDEIGAGRYAVFRSLLEELVGRTAP